MKAPELLLPAGGLERMRAAYDYGADAVYAGSPRYSRVKFKVNKDNKIDKARELCSKVAELSKEYGLSFFFVTEGASITRKLRDRKSVV